MRPAPAAAAVAPVVSAELPDEERLWRLVSPAHIGRLSDPAPPLPGISNLVEAR